jgi:amino acid permease
LGADWMIPIGIFVLMVLVLGLDFLGNNNLHGLDVFEWLVGVPAVAAVICWILFGAVDFVFAGGRKRQASGSN